MKNRNFLLSITAFILLLSGPVLADCYTVCDTTQKECCDSGDVEYDCINGCSSPFEPGCEMCSCTTYCSAPYCCKFKTVCDVIKVTLNQPADGYSTANNNLSFNYTITGSNKTYKAEFRFDGSLIQTVKNARNNTKSGFNLTNIAPGTYLWDVTGYISDTVSNVSETWSVTILGTGPTTTSSTTTTSTTAATTSTTIGPSCPLNNISMQVPPTIINPKTETYTLNWNITNNGETDLNMSIKKECANWLCEFTDTYTDGQTVTVNKEGVFMVYLKVTPVPTDMQRYIGINVTYDDAAGDACSPEQSMYNSSLLEYHKTT